MKKLLGIVVLGLVLTSCSEYMAEQKLEYCADTEYSKEMNDPGNLYLHLASNNLHKKLDMDNEFERNFRLLDASGVSTGGLIDYVREQVRDPLGAYQGFNDTIKRYDNEVKKFLNSSLDQKLKKSPIIHYKYLFSQCELERKETPRTFDARWKKAEIKYLGDIINK